MHRGESLPARSGQAWGTNLVGPLPEGPRGEKWILTVVDILHHYTWAATLLSKGQYEVAQEFLQLCLRTGHWPARLLSDMRSEFVNEVMGEVNEQLGLLHAGTTAYRPQANGETERPHRELNHALRSYCMHQPRRWPKYLQVACWTHNTSPFMAGSLAQHGWPPYKLEYARDPDHPWYLGGLPEVQDGDREEADMPNTEMIKKMQEVWGQVRVAARRKQRVQYDSKASEGEFVPGQWMLIMSHREERLAGRFTGPFKIRERIQRNGEPTGNYEIEDAQGTVQNVNVSRVMGPLEERARVALMEDEENWFAQEHHARIGEPGEYAIVETQKWKHHPKWEGIQELARFARAEGNKEENEGKWQVAWEEVQNHVQKTRATFPVNVWKRALLKGLQEIPCWDVTTVTQTRGRPARTVVTMYAQVLSSMAEQVELKAVRLDEFFDATQEIRVREVKAPVRTRGEAFNVKYAGIIMLSASRATIYRATTEEEGQHENEVAQVLGIRVAEPKANPVIRVATGGCKAKRKEGSYNQYGNEQIHEGGYILVEDRTRTWRPATWLGRTKEGKGIVKFCRCQKIKEVPEEKIRAYAEEYVDQKRQAEQKQEWKRYPTMRRVMQELEEECVPSELAAEAMKSINLKEKDVERAKQRVKETIFAMRQPKKRRQAPRPAEELTADCNIAESEFWGWRGTIKASAISTGFQANRQNPKACFILALGAGIAMGTMQAASTILAKMFVQGEPTVENRTWGVDPRGSIYGAEKWYNNVKAWGVSSREFVRMRSGMCAVSWMVMNRMPEGPYAIGSQATDPVATHARVSTRTWDLGEWNRVSALYASPPPCVSWELVVVSGSDDGGSRRSMVLEEVMILTAAEVEECLAVSGWQETNVQQLDFSAEELKARYKELALQRHPDKHGGDNSLFQDLKHAYDNLKKALAG